MRADEQEGRLFWPTQKSVPLIFEGCSLKQMDEKKEPADPGSLGKGH